MGGLVHDSDATTRDRGARCDPEPDTARRRHGGPSARIPAVHDPERRALADALYAAGRDHDARHADRLARWRNVEPETAALLGVLIRAKPAPRVLEIGTSNGYSTIWLGDAAQATGGALVTLEIEPERTALARENVARAGLASTVDLRTEDAGPALRAFPDGAFDVVFLDSERDAYAGYWPHLVRVLAPAGLLAVDNVISHAEEVADFRALVARDERVTEAIVPIGAGVLLVAGPAS
jgi:predicted O-methyltransferase YrrM